MKIKNAYLNKERSAQITEAQYRRQIDLVRISSWSFRNTTPLWKSINSERKRLRTWSRENATPRSLPNSEPTRPLFKFRLMKPSDLKKRLTTNTLRKKIKLTTLFKRWSMKIARWRTSPSWRWSKPRQIWSYRSTKNAHCNVALKRWRSTKMRWLDSTLPNNSNA